MEVVNRELGGLICVERRIGCSDEVYITEELGRKEEGFVDR